MQKVFHTRQFMAGNSPAIRIPANMAFPHQTPLVIIRDGDRIIVEAQKESLEDVPALLGRIGQSHSLSRPEFTDRDDE